MVFMEFCLVSVMATQLFLCPFTKVEESFNMQAIHDIIFYGSDLKMYDHFDFPGVVPRTFFGSLFIGVLCKPLSLLSEFFDEDKLTVQYIARFVLGVAVIRCFLYFKNSSAFVFGNSVSSWLAIITMTQFHFLFYASRPLPNVFALCLALCSYGHWLRQNHVRFIWISTFATIIFRSELALLFATIVFIDLVQRRISILKLIFHGFFALVFSIGLTVLVDSFFWKRQLWPEGEVLWFNTVENKSSNWGTSPFFWYFYAALPRCLGASLFLLMLSTLIELRTRKILLPALFHVIALSFLPHKELRFIFYTIPVFNLAAATVASNLWRNKWKSFFRFCLGLIPLIIITVNLCLTGLLTYISMNNYPGGDAMVVLHQTVPSHKRVNLHIDNFSAQTGVTRFTQLNADWIYNKTENLKPGSKEIMTFSHLFIHVSNGDLPEFQPYKSTHQILSTIKCFSIVDFQENKPFLYVVIKPCILILRKINLNIS